MDAHIITVTTKGQISIPVSIRKSLHIENGDKLVAYTYGDSLLLKVLKVPSTDEFKKTMDEAQAWASSVGYKESDVKDIIKSVRKKRKNENNT
ncbi:MAG: AbrB/MazE/SpoVT family DNA-binding domain-containing protein [Clostridiales bacterium]|nr:AbrB/MazE/SpoVT family DNA-binding domain-containing protein [Clostridiales bacterium]